MPKKSPEKERDHARLRQIERMESLATLAGSLAHDFNSLNAVTIMRLDMLHDLLENKDAKHHTDQALAAAKRTQELAKQLLIFSHGRTQDQTIIFLEPIVKKTLETIQDLFSQIALHTKLDPNCGPVLANEAAIALIITNLCTNACNAMDESGQLTITLQRVQLSSIEKPIELREHTHTNYCELTIADTGPGIAPEIAEHIFDPFFTTQKKDRGTGLGLSIVYGLVKNYEGAITFDSEPGKGSVFCVLLPEIEKTQKESR